MGTDLLCNKPLTWKETKSSLADVVSHALEAVGDGASAVEIRTNEVPLVTFELKKALFGNTLSSIAALANAKLWALPGRLLIAPTEALTADENDLVSQGMGGEWRYRGQKWDAQKQLEKATVVIVGAEVKERLAAKGTPPSDLAFPDAPTDSTAFPPVRKPYEIAFGELSSTTQQLLLDLLNVRGRQFDQSLPNALTLDPSVTVSFNDSWVNSLDLFLSKPKSGSPTERESIAIWRVPHWEPTR